MPAVADKTVTIRTLERAEKGLVGLATPMFEMVMRSKAGQLAPTADLRRTMDGQLRQLAQRGAQAGSKRRWLQQAKFAVASVAGETALARCRDDCLHPMSVAAG